MTAAFDTFLKQYHATGSEKADGYSRDAFTGLTPQEQEEVFRLLATELPWSVDWLFVVDAERALPLVQEAERTGRNDPYGHTHKLQAAIVNQTGDLAYQHRMIEDYAACDERMKKLVVDAVNRTPANAVTIGFFKKLILTETNEDAVARASRHWLDALDVANATPDERVAYDRLLDDLRSGDTPTKLRAIARAERAARSARRNAG